MKPAILAVLLAGAVGTIATAQTTPPAEKETITDLTTGQVTVVYDAQLSEEFELEREIVDRVQAEFGEHAVYDNGQDLPEALADDIAPGDMLPEGAPVEPIPERLGDLPTLGEGTRWVAVGEHLVEIAPDNRVVMAIYDALPE